MYYIIFHSISLFSFCRWTLYILKKIEKVFNKKRLGWRGRGLVVTWPGQTKHVLPVATRTLPVPFWFFWATVRTTQSVQLWKRRKISKMPRAKQSARRKKFDYNRNRKNVKTKNKKKSNPRIEQWVLACVLILVGMMQKHVVKAAAKTYQWPESRLIDWSSTFFTLVSRFTAN